MLSPNAFNLIVPVISTQQDELIQKLDQIHNKLLTNQTLQFHKIDSLHFGRAFVIKAEKDYPPYFVISTNYDGPLQAHLTEFLVKTNLIDLLKYCVGFPEGTAGNREIMDFLIQNSTLRAYFYRGTWNKKVQQILKEDQTRKFTEKYLDSLDTEKMSSERVRNKILKKLEEEDLLEEFPDYKPPKILWQFILVIIVILILLPVWAITVLVLILILRRYEKTDIQLSDTYSNPSLVIEMTESEDYIVQNQLTHLVDIKPGWFRLKSLKFVLGAIDWAAKYYYNNGKLGGIPSIHYARWVIIDEGKRLLFMTNYDGSWESYLGDFVDKAAIGLTGVWSNTVEYPKSKLLFFKGATDEERFKIWARAKQIKTHVWFTAYKNLSVQNVENNARINKGLFKNLKGKAIQKWLSNY